jgi:hypothetical protein
LSSDKDSGTPGESKNSPPAKPEPFENDPKDPANPNEEIERFREKLRPEPL